MKMRENNTAFHVAVAEISDNPLIVVIVRSVMDLIGALHTGKHQTSSVQFMRRTCHRHEAIVQAMEAKDLVRCEELMAIDNGYTRYLVREKKGRRFTEAPGHF
jgi:DNA-binding GntR family transcriptional regulator